MGKDELGEEGEDGMQVLREQRWTGGTERRERREELCKLFVYCFCGRRGLGEGLGEDVDAFEDRIHEW